MRAIAAQARGLVRYFRFPQCWARHCRNPFRLTAYPVTPVRAYISRLSAAVT
jgi:hypothetical protein